MGEVRWVRLVLDVFFRLMMVCPLTTMLEMLEMTLKTVMFSRRNCVQYLNIGVSR